MSAPFSPTQIKFDGRGIDDQQAVWVRFWTGTPSCPSIIVPLAGLNEGSPELWRRFGEVGVLRSSADKKHVLEAIRAAPHGGWRFKVVKSPGWDLGYVTPKAVFGAPRRIVERDFSGLDLTKFRTVGTLAKWQDQVLSLCAGNSRPMFGVMCAFVGPLLAILGIGCFAFPFFGQSLMGK